MSIIFGIYTRNKKEVGISKIRVMEDALSYWDSDDKGIWSEGSIAFGHQMLWNTPQSKLEHLPCVIYPQNKSIVITIDARLDNREILAEQLEMTDLPFGKITDSELILAAYQKWGEECPKYLLGDFVFAIWDANKEHLFCARDHIGIKPFYYYLNDDLFVFSNDIRGVIAHPEVSKKYNDRSIAMFLGGYSGFYDEKDTFFKEIQKLSAAATITISKEQVSKSVYWDIEDIPKVHYDTYEEYVEKLKELLSDAVKVRLRAAYPVASHLSGGIDSSGIAVLAARELKKRNQLLYAFNWVEIPDEEHDPDYVEWGFATQIANLENIEQKQIRFTADFLAGLYDQIDISTDDVSYYLSEYLVRDEAAKQGVRTILSGWGGDELISYDGYTYLSSLFWQGHFMKAIKEISILYEDKSYKYLRIIKRSFVEMIYPYFYKRMRGYYKEEKFEFDHYQYTRDEFASFAKKQSFEKNEFHPGRENEQKALFTDGHLLQRIEYWASSAIGKKLEYSYPLLDRRIVEFALAIPEELYARKDGHQRYFFRSAISEFLPEHIVWRKKYLEPEHAKAVEKLRIEALSLWMQKNEKSQKNGNNYVNRSTMINRLKIYFSSQRDQEEFIHYGPIMVAILLSNLRERDR